MYRMLFKNSVSLAQCYGTGTIQKRFIGNWLQTTKLSRTLEYKGFHPSALTKIDRHQLTPIRKFHLSDQRKVGPVIWMVLRPVMKVAAVLSGRAFRKWWTELPDDKKGYFRQVIFKSRWKILAALGGMTFFLGANYIAHLQDTPITGRRRFIAFTTSQYSKIADFEANLQTELNKENILPEDHPATKAVLRVGRRLYAANTDIEQMKGMKFQVAVVNDDNNANAFVLPTGHVFVFTGLLKMMENEDQLAVVLGHEMAHAVLSHGIELVSRSTLLDMFVIVVMAAIWAFLPNDGLALISQWFYNKVVKIILDMPYSRTLETEADEVGLLMAAKACFDVREAPVFWTFMSVNDKVNEQGAPEWLSTHPSHDNRAERLNGMMDKAFNVRRECKCPRLPHKDPRAAIPDYHKLLETYETAKNQPAITTVPIVPPAAGALMKTAKTGHLNRKIFVGREEKDTQFVTKLKTEEGSSTVEIVGENEVESADMGTDS